MVASSSSGTTLPAAGDRLDVTAFGAVGNGTTDATAAIQAAALAAAAAGKQLYFPPGTYLVSAALQMPSDATWVASPGTATLVTTNGSPLITAVLTNNDTLNGLTLEGSTTASGAVAALVIGYKVQGLTLVNTTVQDTTGIGVLLSDVNDTTVADSSFSNIGNSPAGLSYATQGVAFTNDTAGWGSGNSVVGSTFFNIGLDAISATGQIGFQAVSNTVTNATINPGWLQLPAAAAGVYGSQDTGLLVADNTIRGVSGNGIDIVASSHVAVYQNTVSGSGGAGIGIYSDTGATVSWNTATNNNVMSYYQTPGGIVVGALNASNIVVAHNLSGNAGGVATQTFGIQVLDGQDAGSSTIVLAQDNNLAGNLTAEVSDPQGTYALVADQALPAMTYAVPINDAPTISLAAASVATTGQTAVAPFAAATIASPDMGVTQALTITVSGGDAAGRLTGSAVVETSTPGTYTVGAPGSTPAAAQAALRGVLFTPAPSQQPVGTVLTTTLTVTDVQSSPTSSTTVSSSARAVVSVTVVAPAPISITPPTGSATTTDQAPVDPFANVVISDPNAGQTETLMVTSASAADGALSDPHAGSDGGSLNNGTYSVAGTTAAIQADLQALVFTPRAHQVAPGQSVTTGLTATISDTAGASASIQRTVVATAVAAPIVATPAASRVASTDEAVASPFSGVVISDPNAGQIETAVVTLSDTADGALSDPSAGSDGATFNNGSYAVSGSPTAVAAVLAGLVFTPTPHQVAVGQTVTTAVSAALSDTAGQQTLISSMVVVTAANDPPAISGIEAAVMSANGADFQPFPTVAITDPDANAAVSLTITVTDATGAASDANGLLSGVGLTRIGTGSYALAAATPAALSDELQSLTFTPAAGAAADGQAVQAGFTLIASQTAGGTTTATTATLGVTVAAANVIAGPASGSAVLVGNGGADTIVASGTSNTIDIGSGSDFINAGQGNAELQAGDGNNMIMLGGGGNTVNGGNGADLIIGGPGGANSVRLGNGNDFVELGGQGDTVQLGDGNDMVVCQQGMAFIATGAGNDTVVLGGSGNTVTTGSGVNEIIAGDGNDTFVLPSAGQGSVMIVGFTAGDGYVLDLQPALQATNWDGQASTLPNYLQVTDSGGGTLLSIAPAGTGAGIPIAQLSGPSASLAGLLANDVLYL